MGNGYTEDDIAITLSIIIGDIAIKKASLNYKIPHTTLQNHIQDHLSHQKDTQNIQKIIPI